MYDTLHMPVSYNMNPYRSEYDYYYYPSQIGDVYQRTFPRLPSKVKDFSINSLLGLDTQIYPAKPQPQYVDFTQRAPNLDSHPIHAESILPSVTSSADNISLDSNRSVNYNEDNNETKSKRIRTIFTAEQLERLEYEFERQQYIVGAQRTYLAHSLNLSENQVKIWYQNRRIKMRKQQFEAREQQKSPLGVPEIYKSNDFSTNSNSFLCSKTL